MIKSNPPQPLSLCGVPPPGVSWLKVSNSTFSAFLFVSWFFSDIFVMYFLWTVVCLFVCFFVFLFVDSCPGVAGCYWRWAKQVFSEEKSDLKICSLNFSVGIFAPKLKDNCQFFKISKSMPSIWSGLNNYLDIIVQGGTSLRLDLDWR